MNVTETSLAWLLDPEDPSVRYFTLTDLFDLSPDSPEARRAGTRIIEGPRVMALLAGQKDDGGFGVHPYRKWIGAHWRLVSLVELGLPAGHPRAVRAAEQVLAWLWSDAHRRSIMSLRNLVRRCASQEGNALAVCCRLGMADDPRVRGLAESLLAWQWPDGGWNCDKREAARHASFYESLAPLWGLLEYHRATGDHDCLTAARRCGEFFLRHGLFRAESTGEVIDPEWLKLHYPLYWHYDILQSLRILAFLGAISDPRAAEALDLIEQKRRADGLWAPEGRYWRPPGPGRSQEEVVDWGRRGPNKMLTLNALRVLKAAGRWRSPAPATTSTRPWARWDR